MKLEASLLAAVAATTLLASCLAPITIAERAPVTIATANPAAIYYPVGNAVCRMVNLADADDPTKRCQAIMSEGAKANVAKVSSGEVTLGLTQSDLAYGAYRGEGSFAATGPHPDLRTVIALQRESFTVIARADSGDPPISRICAASASASARSAPAIPSRATSSSGFTAGRSPISTAR